MKTLLAALALLFSVGVSAAQQGPLPPFGTPVLNQGIQARVLTKSNTTIFQKTRGVFIGDAAACNIAVVFITDTPSTGAVTLSNVQSGAVYPFQIIKLMSTNTTCTSVVALY